MLSKSNAIVVGGLGGIGSEICRSLLKNDVPKLAIIDVREGLTSEFLNNPKIIYMKCGIENRDNLKDVFEKIKEEFGELNLVINSAGIVNEQNAEKVFAINTLGAINFTCIASDLMRKDKSGKGGTIINVASTLGYLPYKGFPIYVASKHAQLGFMKSIGDEEFCRKTGLRFITVCPGYTDTPLIGSSGIHELALGTQDEPFPPQRTSVVSECILTSLKTTKHATFWRCVNGEISEIELLTANDL